jgi:hypothetical protein
MVGHRECTKMDNDRRRENTTEGCQFVVVGTVTRAIGSLDSIAGVVQLLGQTGVRVRTV